MVLIFGHFERDRACFLALFTVCWLFQPCQDGSHPVKEDVPSFLVSFQFFFLFGNDILLKQLTDFSKTSLHLEFEVKAIQRGSCWWANLWYPILRNKSFNMWLVFYKPKVLFPVASFSETVFSLQQFHLNSILDQIIPSHLCPTITMSFIISIPEDIFSSAIQMSQIAQYFVIQWRE